MMSEPIEIIYYPLVDMHKAIFHFFPGVTYSRTRKPRLEKSDSFQDLINGTHYMIVAGYQVWLRVSEDDFPNIKRTHQIKDQHNKIKNNIKKLLRYEYK